MVLVISGILFFAGSLFINPLKNSVNDARTSLDCSNANSISDGTKILCLAVDATIPYFILTFLSIAGGIIISKFIT